MNAESLFLSSREPRVILHRLIPSLFATWRWLIPRSRSLTSSQRPAISSRSLWVRMLSMNRRISATSLMPQRTSAISFIALVVILLIETLLKCFYKKKRLSSLFCPRRPPGKRDLGHGSYIFLFQLGRRVHFPLAMGKP